jgi:rubredoxin
MIVMGSKDRVVDLGEGQFYCPNCGVLRAYIRRRSARYFTLYFIPLFQVENKGEFVECRTCGYIYPPDVLEPGGAQRLYWGQRTTETIRTSLQAGMPIHMLMRKLVGDGFNPELAFHNVWVVMGEVAHTCPRCQFTYHQSIRVCANCGAELEAVRREEILSKNLTTDKRR